MNMSPHKRSVNERTIHKDTGNYRFAQWLTVYTCKAQPVFKVTFEKTQRNVKNKVIFIHSFFSYCFKYLDIIKIQSFFSFG